MDENKPQPQPSVGSFHSDPGPETGKRLDSWKEIAAYLKRDIRTVKRWEKSEGLPVHRHLHLRQASVYAYEEELEAWRENRRPALEAEEARDRERELETGRRPRRWAWLAAGVAVAVAAGLGLWVWLARAPALPFEERDWVLISHFENRTGQPVFEGAVEYALERELANSRFVNVVPRERVQDALRLMRKPPDTLVDAQVGREVCLRDGGIRALITGRVEKLDTTYVLSVGLMNPQTGVTVASFSRQAVGQPAVVAVVQKLADQVRRALGEELASIEQNQEKLAKVTTPSLRALQLFTQADTLIAARNSPAAEELLRQAIVEDPDFASAYTHLAYTILNQGRSREEALPYAKKGVELSDQATERERFFILASYYGMTGETDKAIATYEALLRIYPDHFWANQNMNHWLTVKGRYEEAARYEGRVALLRPNSLFANLGAAAVLSRWATKPFEAKPFVERTLDLAASGENELKARSPLSSSEAEGLAAALVWMELYSAREDWLAGDLKGALHEATARAEELKSHSGQDWERGAWELAQFDLALGKLSAAEKLRPDPDDRAIILFVGNNRQTLRTYLHQAVGHDQKNVGPVKMILAARLGMVPEAEQALHIVENRKPVPSWIDQYEPEVTEGIGKIMRGELARARGRTAEALPLLEAGFNQLPPLGFNTYFLSAESLAELYEQQGNPEKAVEVLRKAAGERRRAVYYAGQAVLLWMRDQMLLAQLYRRLGRDAEADEVEAKLRQLLADADPDHPILQQLQRSPTAHRAGQP